MRIPATISTTASRTVSRSDVGALALRKTNIRWATRIAVAVAVGAAGCRTLPFMAFFYGGNTSIPTRLSLTTDRP